MLPHTQSTGGKRATQNIECTMPTLTIHTRTSLHIASERGYCEVVSSLLAAGANCDCSTQPDGER